MKENKLIQFLLLKPVFSSRNVTTIALVALFFGAYALSGGKVTLIPKVETGNQFGGVRRNAPVTEPVVQEQPQRKSILDENFDAPARNNNKPYKSLLDEIDADLEEENSYEKPSNNKPANDSLSDIEARLKGLGSK